MYSVKETFYSLQGEGAHTGRPAIFCRFTGCNLWSGREQDRQHAVCDFCDTDFIGTDGNGGGKFKTPDALIDHLLAFWPTVDVSPYVIFTGGEPALQLDQALVDACHQANMIVAIETNGTKPLPRHIDWVCVSPKANAELIILKGNELKLVYPQPLAQPHQFTELAFEHFFIQPKDGPDRLLHTQDATAFCLKNPHWRLSLQTHKVLGIE